MKPLIAVYTCWRNERASQAQRQTWVSEAKGIDVKFFFGQGANRQAKSDEIFLNAPDDYHHLCDKGQAAIRWAIANKYTHFFKCDDDLYVRPERLIASGFEKYNYTGMLCPPKIGYSNGFLHGGAGYWLSSRCMDIIANEKTNNGAIEDGWVANVLATKGILGKHDSRYKFVSRCYKESYPESPRIDNDIISAAEFTADEMATAHRIFKQSVNDPYGVDSMSADQYKKFMKLGDKA